MASRTVGKVARHVHGDRVTDHCRQRWAERMPDEARPPRWAFERADRAHGMESHPYFYEHIEGTPTGIHVYWGETVADERYSAVFVEVDGVLVTAYPIDSVDDGPIRAYLHAVGGEGGVVRE
jgi:hypothetical protein